MNKSLLPAKLRAGLRLARDMSPGVINRFLHDPGFELFCLYKGLKNHLFFDAVVAGDPKVAAQQVAPFTAPEVPKIIWLYWKQGEAQAPFVVRRCLESWRHHNPGWEMRVLDDETVSDYIDMSDLPQNIGLAARYDADLLRVRLLETYGGVWADATVYCHRPLESWYPLHLITGFFAFRHPWPGLHIESWLMISEKGHIIPREWERFFTRYIKSLTVQPWVYFVFAYGLQWRIRKDSTLRAAWRRGASLPAQPTFFMMDVLRGDLPEQCLVDMVKAGVPVSKLTWNANIDETAFDSLCERLGSL